jgi:hypothetical protein
MISKNRAFLTIGLVCLAASLGATVIGRQGDIASLRAEQRRLLALTENNPHREVAQPAAAPLEIPSELLRLRNRVAQLSRQQQELANVRAENEHLRLKVAVTQTNGVQSSAEDYIMQKNARMVGFDSPANALQTFLWALRTHDVTTLARSFAPDQMADPSSSQLPEYLKGMEGAVPGFSLVSTQPQAGGSVQVMVQIIPELPLVTLSMKQVDGDWKLTEIPWDLGITIRRTGP